MINVTKTFLPPFDEYNEILKESWDAGWITNRGDLVLKLENQLQAYLDTNKVIAMTNGTLPLQIALKVFGKYGEVITTPFSYVATTSSIVWEGCTPVFVDIHPEYLTIDETKIEAAITNKTAAIMATHVFGNPCNVDEIERIASKYNLKVIYDAAHCFGVKYKGQSIFNYGDVSTCSFHATKIFHTGEGGGIFVNKLEYYNDIFYGHNFGHNGPGKFHSLGINAKMSELQAAMGIATFKYINDILDLRKNVVDLYISKLGSLDVNFMKLRNYTEWNYSYFPIIFDKELDLINFIQDLNSEGIFPRRYFYPSLNLLPFYEYQRCEVSENISKCIVCLPISEDVDEHIVDIISKTLQKWTS